MKMKLRVNGTEKVSLEYCPFGPRDEKPVTHMVLILIEEGRHRVTESLHAFLEEVLQENFPLVQGNDKVNGEGYTQIRVVGRTMLEIIDCMRMHGFGVGEIQPNPEDIKHNSEDTD